MFPKWKTIVYQGLSIMVDYPLATEREAPRISAKKTVSKGSSPNVMLTLYGGQTWQLIMVSDAIRLASLTSLNKTEEMHKNTREAKGHLDLQSSIVKHHTRHYFHLWRLLTTLPFPHSARQSCACLQST